MLDVSFHMNGSIHYFRTLDFDADSFAPIVPNYAKNALKVFREFSPMPFRKSRWYEHVLFFLATDKYNVFPNTLTQPLKQLFADHTRVCP